MSEHAEPEQRQVDQMDADTTNCNTEIGQPETGDAETRTGDVLNGGSLPEVAQDIIDPPLEELSFLAGSEKQSQKKGQNKDMKCTGCGRTGEDPEQFCPIGRAGKVHRCKPCHQLLGRVHRLCSKSGALATDWRQLSAEQKRDFLKQHGDDQEKHAGEALMTALVSFTKERSSTTTGQVWGDFLPLSVYETKGFSAAALKNIANHCPSRWDAVLGEMVYQYNITSGGTRDEETILNHVQYQPHQKRPAPQDQSMASHTVPTRVSTKRIRGKHGDANSEEEEACAASVKLKEEGRRLLQEAKKHKAVVLRDAKKICSLASVVLPPLLQLAGEKLDALPASMSDDLKRGVQELSELKERWTAVLTQGGGGAPADVSASKAAVISIKHYETVMKTATTMMGVHSRSMGKH